MAVLPACRGKEPGTAYAAEAGPVQRPSGPMNADDAAKYVLALVNHDRAEEGLPAVEWDDTAAKAARNHVEDMARLGYTAHWGSDGSVPEQRYTEAGGVHLVTENAACFFDGEARELDAGAKYQAVDLEKIETAFMSETPPNDGHRKNILKKWHTRVGVGLATPRGVPQPCLVQEFVDEYGTYDDLPRTAHPGQTIRVAGEVKSPVKFGGVGISRIDLAKPLDVKHLLGTSTYPMPEPFVLYFPAGYKTPKPVKVDGNRFSIDVPLSDHGRPGRYGVSVWGNFPGDDALVMVSFRTVDVR